MPPQCLQPLLVFLHYPALLLRLPRLLLAFFLDLRQVQHTQLLDHSVAPEHALQQLFVKCALAPIDRISFLTDSSSRLPLFFLAFSTLSSLDLFVAFYFFLPCIFSPLRIRMNSFFRINSSSLSFVQMRPLTANMPCAMRNSSCDGFIFFSDSVHLECFSLTLSLLVCFLKKKSLSYLVTTSSSSSSTSPFFSWPVSFIFLS